MKKSRFFSLLTAAVLTVTGFWQNAALTASAEPEFSGAEIPDVSSIAYSENSFGAMIADTINQENARIMMSSVVHDVEMNGTEATVSYGSTQAGRAVVCVYEDTNAESAPRLLGSGIQAFTAELDTVTVPVQINALPEYYLVRVYLIGENDVPLSAEYTDPMHTREMQTLLRSDISYYMEDYEVLNMDGSTETNYAVYNKDVTVLHYSRTENYVLSQDNENRVFEIRNYTGPTKTGTIVSVECGNGTAAIFKIGSVKTDGDVTTIQGDRSMDTNDAFAYVKLETDAANNSVTYTPPEPSEDNEGIVFSCVTDEKPVQSRPAITGMATAAEDTEAESEDSQTDYQDTVHFRIQFGKGEQGRDGTTGVELDGFVDFQFDYHVTIYKSLGLDKITLDLANIIEIGAEASVTVGTKIPIGTSLVLNPTSSVLIVLGPYLDLSITGMIDLSTVFSWSYGTGQSFHANAAVTDIMLTVEGFIGVGIGGEIWGLGKGGGISVAVGLQADFVTNSPHEGCVYCSDIALYLIGKLNASVDIGIVEVGIEPKIEIELLHCYLSDALGFGWGECPYLSNPPEDTPEDATEENPGTETPSATDDGLTLEQRNFYAFYEVPDGYGVQRKYADRLVYATIPEIPSYYKGVPVVEIAPYAFSTIVHIPYIKLPEKLKRIGACAFSKSMNSNYSAIYESTSIRFPETLESIGNGAFRYSNLTSISLPESLKTIGSSAFSSSSITSVVFPKSLDSIGQSVFYNCKNLQSAIFLNDHFEDGITTIPANAFEGCINLKTVKLPTSLQTIEESAFRECGEFAIHLPNGLISIGDYAFDCTHIGSDPIYRSSPYDVTIPSTVKEIGFKAFDARGAINHFRFPMFFWGELKENRFTSQCTIQEMDLPRNWTKIPDQFFLNCRIYKINLPPQLKEIGANAFSYSSVRQFISTKTLEKIGEGAFKNSSLELAAISSSVTEIAEETFAYCSNIQSISIPDSVKTIRQNAFYRCSALKHIEIPRSVDSMYFSAFDGYTSENTYCVGYSVTDNDDGSSDIEFHLQYAEPRTITFLNPDIQFLDDPAMLKADYIPEGKEKPTIEYGNFLTIKGYPNSTAQIFAQNPDHTCKFISLSPSSQTTQPAEPTDIPQTMTFTGLLPNTIYNFYDLLGAEFTAANLLYLSQGISDSNGTLTVFYRPKSNDTNANKFVRSVAVTAAVTEKPISTIKGDANSDFVVDVSDAVLCARFAAEDVTAKISHQGILNADVSGNGNTDAVDAILILKFIARLITSFE